MLAELVVHRAHAPAVIDDGAADESATVCVKAGNAPALCGAHAVGGAGGNRQRRRFVEIGLKAAGGLGNAECGEGPNDEGENEKTQKLPFHDDAPVLCLPPGFLRRPTITMYGGHHTAAVRLRT